MNNKNNLEKICIDLKNQFDIDEPNIGHLDRFKFKLDNKRKTKKGFKFNYKHLAIAASLVLFIGIVAKIVTIDKGVELAEISPKLEETQEYFTSVIYQELEKINKVKNFDNEQIINDALLHLNKLEINYKELTIELKESNNSKEIIFAMINNYQERINVLQNLLLNIENVKQLKNNNNEKTII